MSALEIPLLRESQAFVRRLSRACRALAGSRYHAARRVNWSYRYDTEFYAREAEVFRHDEAAYLEGRAAVEPRVADVWAQPLGHRSLLTAVAKVLSHWMFAALGAPFRPRPASGGPSTYRKAYVDDIELVFDPEEAGVIRAVYPFPISLKRQWRYLRFLRERGHAFHLAGLPYAAADLLALLRTRRVGALMRLEARAQLRHADSLALRGYRRVQLSDEFDMGSLDFSRRLRRLGLSVVNSAHGVGKYLPVHAYEVFHVLTQRQEAYYEAVQPCRYQRRPLNDKTRGQPPAHPAAARGVDAVLLSQNFGRRDGVIEHSEAVLTRALEAAVRGHPAVRLHYKAHPNHPQPAAPAGFSLLTDLGAVNGRASTVFFSFFSTCQVDPGFKGTKLLVRAPLIHPEIAFDDDEPIVDADGLVRELLGRATAAAAAPAPASAAAGATASAPSVAAAGAAQEPAR